MQTQLTVQLAERRYRGITHTLSSIVEQEGVLSLYRGLGMSLLVRTHTRSALSISLRSPFARSLSLSTPSAFFITATLSNV